MIVASSDVLAPYGIDARHPDEFSLHLLDLATDIVAVAARDHRESLKNPRKTLKEYVVTLEAQGLTKTASMLRQLMS